MVHPIRLKNTASRILEHLFWAPCPEGGLLLVFIYTKDVVVRMGYSWCAEHQ